MQGGEATIQAGRTTVLGRQHASTNAFRGIPYAHVTKRFCQAESVSLESLAPELLATEWGPRCPQASNAGRARRSYLYAGIDASDQIEQSEFKCLNLNVYAPSDGNGPLLPVVVWIHGGGFVFGDAGPEYGK
jgi:para-nitrobenzyl esterase